MRSDVADRKIEARERPCEEVLLLVSAEADGAATEEERLEVARHTARCGACALARADYLAIGAELQAADPFAGATPSPAVWDAIERHLKISTGERKAEPAAAGPATGASATSGTEAAPAARILEAAPARARLSWARAARVAAVAAAVSGAFFAGRVTAPEAPPAAPAGVEVATAQVSAEAEKQALRALADVLSMVSADRRDGAMGGARPTSTRGSGGDRAPEGKKNY